MSRAFIVAAVLLLMLGCGGPSADDFDGDGTVDSMDCAPADPAIYPGALEVCDDGIDNDCDSWADCQDNDCSVQPDQCPGGDDDDMAGDDDDSAGDDDDSAGDDDDSAGDDDDSAGDDDDSAGDDDDSAGDDDDSAGDDDDSATGISLPCQSRFFNTYDYLAVDASTFPTGAAPRTLVAWLKMGGNFNNATVFAYGPNQADQQFGLRVMSSWQWEVSGWSSTTNLNAPMTVTNDWVFAAVTYDGSELKLYQDGTVIASRSTTLNTWRTAVGGTIGIVPDWSSTFNDTQGWMVGWIHSVGLWNRALSLAEIESAMHNSYPSGPSSGLLGLSRQRLQMLKSRI